MATNRIQEQDCTFAGEENLKENASEAKGTGEKRKTSQHAGDTSHSLGNDEEGSGDEDELYGLALLLYNIEQISSDQQMGMDDDKNKQQNDRETTKRTSTSSEISNQNRDLTSKCCPSLNRQLILYKGFYFFFSLAVGALLPYLPVFYKQLWLSAQQTGILIGIRPLIQLVGTPMWGFIADTYKHTKFIFIMSLVAWLVSNYSLCLVSPVFHLGPCKDNATIGIVQEVLDELESSSIEERNATGHQTNILGETRTSNSTPVWVDIFTGRTPADESKREKITHLISKLLARMDSWHSLNDSFGRQNYSKSARMFDSEDSLFRTKSNADLRKTPNVTNQHRSRRKTDVDLLNIIKNSSVADDVDEVYREVVKERDEREFDFLNMVGRYPWPLDMVANYESTQTAFDWQTRHDAHLFTILLVITIIGTLIASPAITLADTATLQNLGKKAEDYGRQRVWGTFGWGLGAFLVGASLSTIAEVSSCNNPLSVDYLPSFYAFACLMAIATTVGALFKFDEHRSHEAVNVCGGLTTVLDYRYAFFLLTVLFCGIALGFIETFLFWHLQDLGGTQLLFSMVALIQCVSEITVYCSSSLLIKWLGHHQTLYLGLLCYIVRFFGYAFITTSWAVLPFEILHGVSSAAVWSAAVVFVGLIPGAHATMQGILAGVHWGLGNGGGGLLGGLMVSYVGAPWSFLIFGLSSVAVLCLFAILNNTKYFTCFQWSKDYSSHSEHPLVQNNKEKTNEEAEYDDSY